jgi:hypothetical protein
MQPDYVWNGVGHKAQLPSTIERAVPKLKLTERVHCCSEIAQ